VSAFKLADSDLVSTTWTKLAKRITQRIDELRAQNDGPLDPVLTAHTRGRIAELKLLLQAAQKDLPPVSID
jgi:hypothetical protein